MRKAVFTTSRFSENALRNQFFPHFPNLHRSGSKLGLRDDLLCQAIKFLQVLQAEIFRNKYRGGVGK